MVSTPWPNRVSSTTSALSTARWKAWRTRLSLKGGIRLFMIAASQEAVGTLSTRRRGIARERLHLVERQVPDHVDIAGLQCRDLDAHFGDDAQFDAVELGQAGLEIVLVLRHHQAVARRVADEFERAGADRSLGRVDAAGCDLDLAIREDVGEAAVGEGQREDDGGRVGGGDVLDHVVVAAGGRGDGGVEQAADHRHNVVGHQHGAVMEFDALAQLEGPGLAVFAGGPAFGQVGLEREVLADAGEAVEHQVVVDVFVADRGQQRIERVQRGADADAEYGSGSGSGSADGRRWRARCPAGCGGGVSWRGLHAGWVNRGWRGSRAGCDRRSPAAAGRAAAARA